ncbi:MAG: hypothetical protein ACFFCI_10280 [Promethearchaeota archaeon]
MITIGIMGDYRTYNTMSYYTILQTIIFTVSSNDAVGLDVG